MPRTAPTSDRVRTDWAGSPASWARASRPARPATTRPMRFVADNYAELRAAPRLLGRGARRARRAAAPPTPSCATMLRVLAHDCGSTALALAMHTHQVAIPAWRWRHERRAGGAAAAPGRGRGAGPRHQRRVRLAGGLRPGREGGGRLPRDARKVFASGRPGDLFMTMAVHDDPSRARPCCISPIPLDAPGVTIHDNWRTLGMRGTGSHDVDARRASSCPRPPSACAGRPGGGTRRWHVVATIALPTHLFGLRRRRRGRARRSRSPGGGRRHES